MALSEVATSSLAELYALGLQLALGPQAAVEAQVPGALTALGLGDRLGYLGCPLLGYCIP